MIYKKLLCSLLFVCLQQVPFLSLAASQTILIDAGADNTLYEDADGSVSNGAGAFMLAGRNNQEQDSIRRALLYFDVAGQLPYGAIVEAVYLTLYLERGNGGERMVRLHHLRSDWGEGGSIVLGGGQGAPAQTGDATWLHSFYPDAFWKKEGGDYIGRVSSSQMVGDPARGIKPPPIDTPGYYTWGSSSRMVNDVRYWQRHPESNFGWILIGDETESQTVKRFSSRTNTDPAVRPVLEVHYSLPQ
jgi:hypothetical protein